MMEDWDRIATEVGKLPPQFPRGTRESLQCGIACGFIFAGNNADAAWKKADAVLEFWDWVTKDEAGDKDARSKT